MVVLDQQPNVEFRSGSSDWKDGAITCIPKKGNLPESDNWMGMILLSIPDKDYCVIS